MDDLSVRAIAVQTINLLLAKEGIDRFPWAWVETGEVRWDVFHPFNRWINITTHVDGRGLEVFHFDFYHPPEREPTLRVWEQVLDRSSVGHYFYFPDLDGKPIETKIFD